MFRSFQTLKIDSNKEKVLENGDTHGERKYFNFEDHVYGTRISRYNRSSFRASRYRDDPLEGCPVNGAHPLSEIRSLSRKKIVITPRRIPSKRLLASIWKSNKSLAAFEKEEGEGEEAIAPSHWLTLYSVARAPLKRNSILAIRQSSPSSIFRQVSFGLDWSNLANAGICHVPLSLFLNFCRRNRVAWKKLEQSLAEFEEKKFVRESYSEWISFCCRNLFSFP